MRVAEPIIARLMKPGDGDAVVALWEKFLPDTEDWKSWLPHLLNQMLKDRAIQGGVVLVNGPKPRCAAAGISCFLPEAIADDFVARPRPYLNCRLLLRYRDGDASVFLSPEEQSKRNAGSGLEMFVLEYCQETFDFDDPWAHQILNSIVPFYIKAHVGFNIRRCMHETEIAVGHIQESGGSKLLFEVAPQDPFSLSPKGHGPRGVYGVSRDDISASAATGISKSTLFCDTPKFELVLQEQNVVSYALDGMTDLEIAENLGVSRDRVRQIWNGIYNHLEDISPDFFANVATSKSETRRGGEKRRGTIAYLGQNPHELRPRVLRRG